MKTTRTPSLSLLFASLVLAAASPAVGEDASSTEVDLARDIHFNAPDGSAVIVPAGPYEVRNVSGTELSLVSAEGDAIIIGANEIEHDEQLDETLALTDDTGDDEFHVLLLLPGAVALDAAGSFSGIATRATRPQTLNRQQVSLARTHYNQVRVPPQGAQPTTVKRLFVVPGRSLTFRFDKAPEENAYGARLVDPRSGKQVPSNIATVAFKRGTVDKRDSNGRPFKAPFAQVTVKASPQFRYGDYQLWLLRQDGKPLTVVTSNTTRQQANVAPVRLSAVAANHPAVRQQKAAVATTQPGRVPPSGTAYDPARDLNRANQVQDRLNQAGMPGLEPGSLAGSGLLLAFGDDLRTGFMSQLGGFPEGSFSGILEGGDGGSISGSTGGSRFQPNMSNPAKDASALQGGRTSGDSRLMSGGSGGGDTFTIVSSSTDTQSSDGTQKITDSINVTNDDGSTFSHTMTHETHADGSVTETQTATHTDADGNTTSESSTTTTDKDGKTTTTTTSTTTDKDGKTKTATTTTTNPASTPDPEGGDCTGQQCEEFMAFTEAFLTLLASNRIGSKQTDPGSMMQPGDGTTTAGGRSNATLDKAASERLNPYILHDNAGSSSVPMPAGSNTRPTIDKKDTLVDPPRGDTLPPGGTELPPGSSPDTSGGRGGG